MGKLKLLTRIFFLFLFFISAMAGFSQTGTVRGFVYEKETGEPVIFTNVLLKGTAFGSTTDVNGFYTITKVPAGNYILLVTSLGYDTLSVPIEVKQNEILNKKLMLPKASINLGAAEVTAEEEEKRSEVRISVTKVTPREIRQVPSAGGESDLAQYLQILPGAVFTGDQGGQLYIRGGAPIQNKVLLDGMIIYNPFHSIGFMSVFDTDIIRNVDVFTGGFQAEYGGRISSIMDITSRDGNKNRHSGKVSASTFGAKLLLEGPILKSKSENEGSVSYVFSAKNSYLNETSKSLYSYADSLGLPYKFNDLYGKVSYNSATGNKLNLFGFRFEDRVKFQHISDLGWNTGGFGSNFVLVPSGTQALIGGNLAYSTYKISLAEGDDKPRESTISSFNMGLGFTYFPGRNEIKYGFDILALTTNFNFYNAANRHIAQNGKSTEVAGYLTYKKTSDFLVVEPGFRIVYYANLAEFSPEPRLGMKMNITDHFRFKAAGGLYSQNLISANSDKDVVNLFYGFLTGSEELPDKYNNREIKSRLQKANHIVAGFEYDLSRHLELNIEGYLKNFTQLTNINRDKLFEDNEESADRPDIEKKDFIIETGQAKGIDFVLKYDIKRFYAWAVYSYAFVNREDGTRKYPPHFDRRHNANLVLAYMLDKKEKWELDIRWNYGSGFPFTPNAGFFEQLDFNSNINFDYTAANGNLGTIYGDVNSKRLSDYHRLDLTVKKKFKLSKNSNLETFFNLLNAYNNQKNVFYFNRFSGKSIFQLPIIPSAGLSIGF